MGDELIGFRKRDAAFGFQRLAERDNIGFSAVPLGGEQLASAPEAGLDLIGDEKNVIFLADSLSLF